MPSNSFESKSMAAYSQYHSMPTWTAVSSTATRVGAADGESGTLLAS
ncbi:hypothetical protein [Halocatena pleomorpha]|nr:hypothetical protein [Halocatena pleomorpha]